MINETGDRRNRARRPSGPAVVDRERWQAQLDELLVREKAHTREGDAIAAARRRLPMVEVDPSTPLIGAHGPVPLIDAFEGRRQLIAYFHMWHDGQPAEDQCEGCTFFNGQVRELSYLHSRDVTYATFCQGPYPESAALPRLHGLGHALVLGADSVDALLAGRCFGMLVCYLRDGDQVFETYWTHWPRRRGDGAHLRAAGPDRLRPPGDLGGLARGWPQHFGTNGEQFRLDGRPTAQWSRLAAGPRRRPHRRVTGPPSRVDLTRPRSCRG